MTFLYRTEDPMDVMPDQVSTKAEAGNYDVWKKADENWTRLSMSNSVDRYLADEWQAQIDYIKQQTGKEFLNPTSMPTGGGGLFSMAENAIMGSSLYDRAEATIADYVAKNQDKLSEIAWLKPGAMRERVRQQALQNKKELEEMIARSPTTSTGVMQFLGGMTGVARDPVVVASMFAGGASGARSLWSLALSEMIIGAGAEAIVQKEVASWYKELGLEYSYKDFVANVSTAGIAGAVFPVAVTGVAKGVKGYLNVTDKMARAGAKKIREKLPGVARAIDDGEILKGLKAFRAARKEPSLDNDGLVRQGENIAADAADSPYVDPNVHLDYLTRALADLDAGRLPPPPPSAPLKSPGQVSSPYVPQILDANLLDDLNRKLGALKSPGQAQAQAAARRPNVETFNAADIEIDAKVFQFKTGSDEFGVTDGPLLRATQWNPASAGTLTVYQYANGRTFIADGHQRLGLAKRLMSQDPNLKIEIDAYVLREVDGITPEQAMVRMAQKNLDEVESKVSAYKNAAVDVAKILRAKSELQGQFSGPNRIVQTGRSLTLLHDENFLAVVNDLVTPQHAAIVGRIVPLDPARAGAALEGEVAEIAAKQQAILSYLQKAVNKNATEFEVEAIVRQMAADDFLISRQENLFGESVAAESLYLERARVLDEVRKILKTDRRVFSVLNRNTERLEAEGNQLAVAKNKQRELEDGQAIEILQALATVRGPIADAITQAARTAKETKRYAEVARGVADTIREGVERGDVYGPTLSNAGRFVDDSTQVSGRPEMDDGGLEAFDNPLNPEAMRQADTLTQDIFDAPARAAEVKLDRLDEDAYIRLINPEGIRIADRPVVLAADMEGMLPGNAKLVTESEGVQYLQSGDDIYAKVGDSLVGYAKRSEDGGVDLTVAQEFQGRGIGGELSFLYRSQDPKAYSGGLTAAGEAVARKTFRRFADIQLEKDSSLYFESTADSINLPVSQLRPTRARPEGIFNAKVFMDQAGKGTRSKRPPVPVKDNGDGTFTLWDGNSTYAISVEAGFETIPVKVMTPEQFKADVQTKNAKRVLNPEGKKKKRVVMMKDGDENEMIYFLRTAKQRQNLTSLENLVGRGEINHRVLNDELARISNELGIEHKLPAAKTEGRILEKLAKDYNYNAATDKIEDFLPNIVDAARGGIGITKPGDVDAVIKQLNKKFHVIDKGFNLTEEGYLDAKILVMMNDGQLAEVQFWPPGMFQAKDGASLARFGYPDTYTTPTGEIKPNVGGQRLYEIVRANEGTPEAIAKATEDMRALYGEVIDSLPSSFDAMLSSLGIARRSASNKSATVSASSREISGDDSLRKMPAGSPGPAQRLEASIQTNDLLASETAASVDPSIKKNLIGPSTDSLRALTDEVNDIVKDVDDITTYGSLNEVLGLSPNAEPKLADIKRILDQDDQMLNRFKDCV